VQGIARTPSGQDHRDQLLERLHHLRTIVPVFAQELATARRQSARLRVENQRLVQEVRRLQRKRAVADRLKAGGEPTQRPVGRREPLVAVRSAETSFRASRRPFAAG
jgi:hypothetical protein